jgi:nitronate monooxygenase
MGTRFMLTRESPLHPILKERFVQATERDTVLIGRSYGDSSRVMRNAVSAAVLEREKQGGVTHHDLLPLIGAQRWMEAMATGDVEGGAIPLGMSVGLANDLPSCAELIARMVAEARQIVQDRLVPITAA